MPAIGATGSASGMIWAQLQQQQAQRTADQAAARARALQAQASQAQAEARQADDRAQSLQSESAQADVDAGNARRNLAALDTLGQTRKDLASLQLNIRDALAGLQVGSVAASGVFDSEGPATGTRIDVRV